jgi:disulfide bond formation protein DsbB
VAAFIKPNTILKNIFTLLQVLTALGGSGVAIRHWWLQAHRESMIADCGVGFDYMFDNFPLQKALTLVFRGTGDCAAIDWTFLGLSIPQLSLIAFVGFAGYALYLTKK